MRQIVYICSPYRAYGGHCIAENVFTCRHYCRRVCDDEFIAMAPQLYFPQFYDDADPEQRERCLKYCKRIIDICDQFFIFPGENEYISSGMSEEIAYARTMGKRIVQIGPCHEYRTGKDSATQIFKKQIAQLVKIHDQIKFGNPLNYDEQILQNIDNAAGLIQEKLEALK